MAEHERGGRPVDGVEVDPRGSVRGGELEHAIERRLPAVPEPRSVQVVTQLSVRRGRAAVDFYTAAFGAVVDFKLGGTDEEPSVVAQLSIGGAPFWVNDESPEHGHNSPETVGGATTRTLLIVDDPEDFVDRAVSLGATLTGAVEDQYGWRLGSIEDPFGHGWEIGHPLGAWPPA